MTKNDACDAMSWEACAVLQVARAADLDLLMHRLHRAYCDAEANDKPTPKDRLIVLLHQMRKAACKLNSRPRWSSVEPG